MEAANLKDAILLYSGLRELILDLEAAPSGQLNWRAVLQYDTLFSNTRQMVDDSRFGEIWPSSGYQGSLFGRLLAPYRFPPPDTVERLRSKAILLERYVRNYIWYYYPDVAARIWPSESNESDVDSEQEYIAERFRNVETLVKHSVIEEDLVDIALYDLEQAVVACRARAFKACIVMLGAVLESLMLGTIRRPDVIDRLRKDAISRPRPDNYPKRLLRMGLEHPEIADKIARGLDFERYKEIVCYLIPEVEKLQVEGIQRFRNAIHPWNTVTEPSIYAEPGLTRVANHAIALEILAERILRWNP